MSNADIIELAGLYCDKEGLYVSESVTLGVKELDPSVAARIPIGAREVMTHNLCDYSGSFACAVIECTGVTPFVI